MEFTGESDDKKKYKIKRRTQIDDNLFVTKRYFHITEEGEASKVFNQDALETRKREELADARREPKIKWQNSKTGK